MNADAIYTDRIWTALYDALNPAGPDTDFYLSLPEPRSAILDIGCGTGLLASAYAEQGHEVFGLDPAPAMLEIARARPGGDRVTWIEADARTFDVKRQFDLIVMTGHVFQVFLDDDDVLRVLTSARKHLRQGGRLVFDSRNPEAGAWQSWTPEHSRKAFEHPVFGHVETWHQVESVERCYVSFASFAAIADRPQPVVSRSRLAFRSQEQIDVALAASGFLVRQWLGGWNHTPFQRDSAEIIALAS